MKTKLRNTLAALAVLSVSGLAMAQERGGDHRMDRGRDGGREFGRDFGRDGGRPFQGRMVLDHRYHHDHYYPAAGQVMLSLPLGSIQVGYRGMQFYYHGGVWLRPVGPRFVVVAPPLGVLVPSLPPSYVPLLIGGATYFYANGVYYSQVPGQGFAVVPTPAGAEYAQPMANVPPAANFPVVQSPMPQPVPHAQYPGIPQGVPEPILYPRNGQTPAQSAADQNECRRWAVSQPNGSVDANIYQRALSACLDGRGYTVR